MNKILTKKDISKYVIELETSEPLPMTIYNFDYIPDLERYSFVVLYDYKKNTYDALINFTTIPNVDFFVSRPNVTIYTGTNSTVDFNTKEGTVLLRGNSKLLYNHYDRSKYIKILNFKQNMSLIDTAISKEWIDSDTFKHSLIGLTSDRWLYFPTPMFYKVARYRREILIGMSSIT